jgi:integrase
MFREKHGLTDSYYTQKHGNKLYRISTHTIRHWHLTKLYEKSNHDVLLVADIIGHKKLETTFQYLRAWKKLQREEELVNAMAAI